MHGEFLFRDEPLAALGTHVLPAVIALVSLLTEIQPTPEMFAITDLLSRKLIKFQQYDNLIRMNGQFT